jgi:hypothetical protein
MGRIVKDPRNWQLKMQITDENVDRVRILLCSDRILGVRLIAEELNTRICMEEKTRTQA